MQTETIINVKSPQFTPSEAFLIHAEEFDFVPYSKRKEGMLLFDGVSVTDRVAFCIQYIAAAIIANVDAGILELEVRGSEDGTGEYHVCVPTGNVHSWPEYTLEARLVPDRAMALGRLVSWWLLVESTNPFGRVISLSKVLLMIRGHAVWVGGRWPDSQVLLKKKSIKEESLDIALMTWTMLNEFARHHPRQWALLVAEIENAINITRYITQQGQHVWDHDPWDAESAAVKEKYKVLGVSEFSESLAPRKTPGLVARITGYVLLLALVGGIGYAAYRYFDEWASWLILLIIIGILLTPLFIYLFIKHFIKERTVKSIKRVVTGEVQKEKKGEGKVLKESMADVKSQVNEIETIKPAQTDSVQMEILTADSFPAISGAGEKAIDLSHLRNSAAKLMYIKHFFLVSAGAILPATLFSVVSFFETGMSEEFHATLVFLHFVIFFIMPAPLFRKSCQANPFFRLLFAAVRAKPGEVSEVYKQNQRLPPRAEPQALAGLVFIVGLLVEIRLLYLQRPLTITAGVCAGLAVALVLFYVIGIQKERRIIEQQFPYYRPYNLLVLRVFGSPHLANFFDLIKGWRSFGNINLLDGSDNFHLGARHVFHFLKGKIEDCIVEDEKELVQELERFRSGPDGRLRFGINSMYCTDAIWQKAVADLFSEADVIAMDFSALSEKNQGIAYEIQKLLDEFPINRAVLLVDDSTDLRVLEKLFQQAMANLHPDSPNKGAGQQKIQLIYTGGIQEKRDDESEYDFRRRQQIRLDGEKLVGLLLDKALLKRPFPKADPRKDAAGVYWTGFRFSYQQRRLWNGAMILLLVAAIALSISPLFL